VANKQITDLDASNAVGSTDLLLVRKSGQAEDTSINIGNFITAIGNTSVNGYYQDSYDFFGQIMSLKPSNDADVIAVGEGMKASFLATDDIDGQSYITFDGNESYPLYQYNKDLNPIPVDIGAGDYIETIFSNDQFFQVNIPTTQIYTNDYLAVGMVAVDELSTTYTLSSAIGVLAQSYYNGMSIIFTSDIESKGSVFVNVDGLGDQVLTDKAGDMIANNLEENQVILAIYNGTDFIKNYFSESVPEAPELPADAIDDEGEVIIENVPDDNKVQVTVGNAGNDYTTINDALADLSDNYGDDGGNRIATILLSDTYTWNEEVSLLHNNYSWITINSSDDVNGIQITIRDPLTLSDSSICLSGKYRYNATNFQGQPTFIKLTNNSNIYIHDFQATSTNYSLFIAYNSRFTIENSTFIGSPQASSNNYMVQIQNCYNSIIKDSSLRGSSSGSNPSVFFIRDTDNITLQNVTAPSKIVFRCSGSKITVNDCNFTFASAGNNFVSSDCISLDMNNTTMQLTTAQNSSSSLLSILGVTRVNLTNCQIQATPTTVPTSSASSLKVTQGVDVTISGGDYSGLNGAIGDYNISAASVGTIVRLKDDPIGGTTATSGAVIINE
jgi:hypothetical protein